MSTNFILGKHVRLGVADLPTHHRRIIGLPDVDGVYIFRGSLWRRNWIESVGLSLDQHGYRYRHPMCRRATCHAELIPARYREETREWGLQGKYVAPNVEEEPSHSSTSVTS